MAISLTGFRNKLDVKLWGANSPIARDITIYNIASSTTDAYGEQYNVFDSGTVVKSIPYNKFTYQQDFLQWGELQDGQTEMVFKHDTTLKNNSMVVDTNGTTTSYQVEDIELFPYGAGSVAQVARLREKL